MKKRYIVIFVISVLIALAVCLLPWPTRINTKMYGAEVTSDGEIQNSAEFIFVGWKLDYLFRDDELKLNFSFSNDGNASFRFAEAVLLDTPSGFLMSAYYSTTPPFWTSDFFTGIVVFTEDLQYCAMAMTNYVGQMPVQSPTCFVASLEPDFDPVEILKIFDAFKLTA